MLKGRTKNRYNSEEEFQQAVLDTVNLNDADAASKSVKAKKISSLLEKTGYTYIDIRNLVPNPENSYSIDPESIEGLAKLIRKTKNTDPLLVMETDEGYMIIDGERRYRAHMLLAEEYGPVYYTVPVRLFEKGKLSSEDVKFLLHAENIGQRTMKESERAEGFAVIYERISKTREGAQEGERTRDVLARQFGCSPRQVSIEVALGSNLIQEGKDLLDNGAIGKKVAYAIALLSPEDQKAITDQIEKGILSSVEAMEQAKETKQIKQAEARGERPRKPRKPKGIDDDIKSASAAFRRALKRKQRPDRVTLAKLKDLVDEMQARIKELEAMEEELPKDQEPEKDD